MAEKLEEYSSSRLFELLMKNESPVGIAILTPDLVYTRVNVTMRKIIGLEEDDILGKHCYDLIGIHKNNRKKSGIDKICDYCASLRALQSGDSAEMIQEISSDLIAHVLAHPLKAESGEIIGTMEIMENIADKVNDPLTGVKNYRYFEEAVGQECYRALRNDLKTSVVFIDLDNFKNVNDTFGHAKGDLVLKNIARYFESMLRKSDNLCRLGGDEFSIIAVDTDKKDAEILIKRLRESLEERFTEFELSFSYGIATIPDDSNDPTTLREIADSRLYKQKDSRKSVSDAAFDLITPEPPPA